MGQLLITAIGKAKVVEAEKGQRLRYETLTYRFPSGAAFQGAFFGKALFDYLSENNPPDLVVVGTSGSTWSILETFLLDKPEIPQRVLQAHHKVEEAEKGGTDLEKALSLWQETLGEFLGTRLAFVCLKDPPDPEEVAKKLLTQLERWGEAYREIHLDVTHGYRYMGYALLGAILPLRHIWGTRIFLHYGGLEIKGSSPEAPVVGLESIQKFIHLDESLNTLLSTGDFRSYFRETVKQQEAERAYFFLEVNRQENATRPLNALLETPSFGEGNNREDNVTHQLIHRHVKRVLDNLSGDRFETKLVNRARFFFERQQYFKAFLLIFEAILIVGIRRFLPGEDVLDYQSRIKAREQLEEAIGELGETYGQTYKTLRRVRNAIAHGTRPEGSAAQAALSSPEKLEEIFKASLELFAALTNPQAT